MESDKDNPSKETKPEVKVEDLAAAETEQEAVKGGGSFTLTFNGQRT